MDLSRFIMSLQWERAAVSLSVFLDAKSGKTTDLSKEYKNTDRALRSVKWRVFGPEKVFENPLRFQIRIDDFRFIYSFQFPSNVEILYFLSDNKIFCQTYCLRSVIGKRLPTSTRLLPIKQKNLYRT